MVWSWRLAALLGVLACVAVYLYRTWWKVRGLPRVCLDELTLRTGDLLLFISSSASPVTQLISVFTHVGMVVERGGAQYILETHEQGDAARLGVFTGGVHLHPLRARVLAYEGRVCALRLRPGAAPDELNLWRHLPSLSDIPFHSRYRSHYAGCCVAKSGCGRRAGMFCSEFVGLLLKLLGLLPPETPLQCLTPESFVSLSMYAPPVFLSACCA